jgi:small subunit ribosomal protein S1
MSEEMNKELETEVIAGVTAEEPVETMEDFAAELEASYKTLKKKAARAPSGPSLLR